MIAEVPVIPIDARSVMCDGSHDGVAKEQVNHTCYVSFLIFFQGHPRVWINLDDGEIHDCPYCGLRYQKKAAYDAAAALSADDEN